MIHLGVASRCPLLLLDMIRSVVSSRLWTVARGRVSNLKYTVDDGGSPLGGHECRTMFRARGWFPVAAWHTRDKGRHGDLETSISLFFAFL